MAYLFVNTSPENNLSFFFNMGAFKKKFAFQDQLDSSAKLRPNYLFLYLFHYF